MKISTKGRYALRLLLDLAEHKNDGYIALKDIANRQNVSKKYLEQIIPILNRSDILSANRGYALPTALLFRCGRACTRLLTTISAASRFRICSTISASCTSTITLFKMPTAVHRTNRRYFLLFLDISSFLRI